MAGVSYFHLDESLEPLLEEEMWTGTDFFFFFPNAVMFTSWFADVLSVGSNFRYWQLKARLGWWLKVLQALVGLCKSAKYKIVIENFLYAESTQISTALLAQACCSLNMCNCWRPRPTFRLYHGDPNSSILLLNVLMTLMGSRSPQDAAASFLL